jgi:rRNA maturation endonuclease Nob1
VLDATAFIGLDFPILQSIPDVNFFTTLSVELELKDFRSRMNIDILKSTGRLQFGTPEQNILNELKKQIQVIDPQTPLSPVDLDILAVTYQLNGTLISNISGKKITHPRKWQLKCTSCGKIGEIASQTCAFCGGNLKRVSAKTTKLSSDQIE